MNLANLLNLFSPLRAIALAVVVFLIGLFQGKNSAKNHENQEAANAIKKRNTILKDVNRLSDNELDSELRKWK